MESKIVEIKEPVAYPKLMISEDKNIVVLFYELGRGQVVFSSSPVFSLGEYSESWRQSFYEDFHGTITITA